MDTRVLDGSGLVRGNVDGRRGFVTLVDPEELVVTMGTSADDAIAECWGAIEPGQRSTLPEFMLHRVRGVGICDANGTILRFRSVVHGEVHVAAPVPDDVAGALAEVVAGAPPTR